MDRNNDVEAAALAVLAAYGTVSGVDLGAIARAGGAGLVRPLGDGLINETFLVAAEAPGASLRLVLQRVNPIFGPLVHEDIDAVTRHLERKGLLTPRLVPTAAGRLYVEHDGGVWRLLTYVPGQCFAVMTKERAEPAGELVGRFHAAVQDCEHGFRFSRPGAHDLGRHLLTLAAAVDKVRGAGPAEPALLEPEREAFLRLADEVARRAAELPSEVPGPLRLCHGDLKLNNLRFDDAGRGVCLLDLDTLARLPLALELGDALRSWCNPLGEDDADARFDLGLFERALRGYAVHARDFIRAEEREFLVRGVERVALQLAARFGADVVNQSYFRWDPQRFTSRAAHNLIRARSQLGVARSLDEQRSGAEALVGELLG
ncbi:MAG: phosphotransferase [Polyangia bacterium]